MKTRAAKLNSHAGAKSCFAAHRSRRRRVERCCSAISSRASIQASARGNPCDNPLHGCSPNDREAVRAGSGWLVHRRREAGRWFSGPPAGTARKRHRRVGRPSPLRGGAGADVQASGRDGGCRLVVSLTFEASPSFVREYVRLTRADRRAFRTARDRLVEALKKTPPEFPPASSPLAHLVFVTPSSPVTSR